MQQGLLFHGELRCLCVSAFARNHIGHVYAGHGHACQVFGIWRAIPCLVVDLRAFLHAADGGEPFLRDLEALPFFAQSLPYAHLDTKKCIEKVHKRAHNAFNKFNKSLLVSASSYTKGRSMTPKTCEQAPVLKTREQVRNEFRSKGLSISAWAVKHGFNPALVTAIINDDDARPARKCLRGDSHNIAVALGIKSGEVSRERLVA